MMLNDQDWIFMNIYGMGDCSFVGVKKCGYWDGMVGIIQCGCDSIINEMKVLGLWGCGGVGFLIGMKWFFMFKEFDGCLVYLVINVDEFEFVICKDREIMCYDLYMLIEGVLIVSFVMGVYVVYIYICGEFICECEVLQVVIDECYDDGLLGWNVVGLGWDFDLYLYYGVGVYICGEEIVLLESLEGKKGMFWMKLFFLVGVGFYGCLIMVNNVEFIVVVFMILWCGGEWFVGFGCLNNVGVKLFGLIGYVNMFCVVEEVMLIFMCELIEKYGGGIWGGWKNLKVVIFGGVFCLVLMVEQCENVIMDYDGMCELCLFFGIVCMIVMDQDIDIIKVIWWLLKFFKYESCG